jgi:hypothetical protein
MKVNSFKINAGQLMLMCLRLPLRLNEVNWYRRGCMFLFILFCLRTISIKTAPIYRGRQTIQRFAFLLYGQLNIFLGLAILYYQIVNPSAQIIRSYIKA